MLAIKKVFMNKSELLLEEQKNKLIEQLKKIAGEFRKICNPSIFPESVLQTLRGLLQYKNKNIRSITEQALKNQSRLLVSVLHVLVSLLQNKNEKAQRINLQLQL